MPITLTAISGTLPGNGDCDDIRGRGLELGRRTTIRDRPSTDWRSILESPERDTPSGTRAYSRSETGSAVTDGPESPWPATVHMMRHRQLGAALLPPRSPRMPRRTSSSARSYPYSTPAGRGQDSGLARHETMTANHFAIITGGVGLD